MIAIIKIDDFHKRINLTNSKCTRLIKEYLIDKLKSWWNTRKRNTSENRAIGSLSRHATSSIPSKPRDTNKELQRTATERTSRVVIVLVCDPSGRSRVLPDTWPRGHTSVSRRHASIYWHVLLDIKWKYDYLNENKIKYTLSNII